MLANPELMEKEFWSLAETEGIADIDELNKILDRAVNLKNFLKGDDRVEKVAQYVAEHFRENVEPLGYKAFLVAVDRAGLREVQEGPRQASFRRNTRRSSIRATTTTRPT